MKHGYVFRVALIVSDDLVRNNQFQSVLGRNLLHEGPLLQRLLSWLNKNIEIAKLHEKLFRRVSPSVEIAIKFGKEFLRSKQCTDCAADNMQEVCRIPELRFITNVFLVTNFKIRDSHFLCLFPSF